MTDTYCSLDLEYLTVRCHPFCLPWEFTVFTITAVYIPFGCQLHLLTVISKQQRDHPDGVFVIAGEFNEAKLKTVLPEFHQHVHCPQEEKTHLTMFIVTSSMGSRHHLFHMVHREQSHTQRQKKQNNSLLHSPLNINGGEGGQLQIPGHTHLWGPHIDSKQHSAC